MNNTRGSALLNAIVVAGIVAVISGVILTQTQVTDKASRNPRIKSAMTVLETQMLSLAMQPGIYQNCGGTTGSSGYPNPSGGHNTQGCQISPQAVVAFENLNRSISGAICHQDSSSPGGKNGGGSSVSSAPCGAKVQAPSSLACLNPQNANFNANCLAGQFYNSATQTFCAEIVYQGTELAMQPVCATTVVPQSILQGGISSCTSAANLAGPYPHVIFKGYDSAGSPVCAPIPSCSGGNVASAGNYITSIDKLSMQTQCKTIGSGFLSCPPGMVISGLHWTNVSSGFGTIAVATNCKPRQAPPDNHVVAAIAPPTTLPGSTLICSGVGTLCFVAGTPVTMANGLSKPIEKVQVGDLVQTFDEKIGQTTSSFVIDILHHHAKLSTLYTFTFSDGSSVTSNDVHLFFLPIERTYITAEQMVERFERKLPVQLLSQNGEILDLASVKKSVKNIPLYNIHVQSPYDREDGLGAFGHNYFAGGVLVHNAKGGKAGGPPTGGAANAIGDYECSCSQNTTTGQYLFTISNCTMIDGSDCSAMDGTTTSATSCASKCARCK